ncbi:MAG: adenosine kinase [Acidimicrobiales bacterium]
MTNIVAIGNAIVDVLTREDDELLDRLGLVKGTMALTDRARAEEIYAAMSPGTECSGGSAANTAAGVASLGGSAAFVGKVGDDALGEVFTHDIRAAGVVFEPNVAEGGDGTARCLVLVTPDAQRTLNTHLGVASQLTVDDIDESLVGGAAITYLEGYLWDQPSTKDALRAAMAAAHGGAGRVAFTLSDPFCVDRHRAEFRDLIAGPIDILFANEAELCSLYETDDFEAAVAEVAASCDIAAVTRGEEGSVLASRGRLVAVAAEATEVVDTTGAGDLYAAGVLFGLCNDLDLETCGRLGAIAAAEVISHLGARPLVSLATLVKPILG